MSDWADKEAQEILKYLSIASQPEFAELLAAKFRSIEATGATRGTVQLAASLEEKFGKVS